MIKFAIEKIQLRNVRNYGDDIMEMDFPLDNLTVFTGHVGAGKSTILKAVSMALYGDDGGVKGEKLSIDDMVNERTGKNLEIHLFFKAVDTLNENHTDNYEIHLYHKHSKMGNKLVFMKNGADISANGKMDTYRLVEKTTIPKEVYHNIYYFTQQAKNFFTALPNSEQKAIFDSILDLSDYDKYYQNCRNNITEYEQKISECELKIKMIESNISEKETMISNERIKIESLKKENESQINNLELEIEKLRNELKDHNESEFILGDNVKNITESIHKLESDTKVALNNLTNEITNLEKRIGDIKNKYQILFADEKSRVKDNLDKLNNPIKEEIQKLELKKNDSRHLLEKELSDLETERQSKENKIESAYKEKRSKYEQLVKDLERDLLDYQSKVKTDYLTKQNEINTEISKIKSEINDIQYKVNQCKYTIDESTKRLNESKRVYESNKKQLESDTPICDKCGQPLINLDRLKREQVDLEKKIDEFNQNINNVVNDEKILVEDISKRNSNCENYKKQLETYKTEIVSSYNTKKVEIEKKISEFKKLMTDIDDSKKSEITAINREYDNLESDVDYKYDKLNREVSESIQTKNESIELNTNNAKNELILISQNFNKKINDECSNVRDEIKSKTLEKSKLNNEYTSKYQKLQQQLETAENNERDIQNLKNSINEKQSELKLKKEYSISTDTLSSLETSIKSDREKYESLKVSKKELDKTLKILEFWKTAFSDSGIKSMLIDVAIPHMNQCVREELDRVCPGTFTVSFDTLSETKSGNIRDKFSINIIHNIKCATGHKKLSGGEKRIIDFCCMAALRSLAEKLYGKMFSHIFYDEVLDSLDSESRELFCRSMKNQSNDHRNITLVTHALTEDVDPDRVFPF